MDDCIKALKSRPDLSSRVREFLVTAGVDFKKLNAKKQKVDVSIEQQTPALCDAPENPFGVPTDEFDRLPLCDTSLGLTKVERLRNS